MRVDHIAVNAANLPETARWYIEHFGAEVLYQDDTWAFLKIGGTKLALLTPGQHPPHMAFSVTEEALKAEAKRYGKTVKEHRDGTASIYIEDPSGNSIELIAYRPGHAYEEAKLEAAMP